MTKKISRCLISVSDKTDLDKLLKVIKKYEIEIISTGGTYEFIKSKKYDCIEISEFTEEQVLAALQETSPEAEQEDFDFEWEIDEDDIQFVRFTALKSIADGEEIFQNYGDEYWATRCED